MSYTYQYPRPMVTVDAILITQNNQTPQVLLIKRKHYPFEGFWALPGGFVDENEAPEEAVAREMLEETGVSFPNFIQFRTYGKPGRDPRGHTISIVFYAFTPIALNAIGTDDAADAQWFDIDKIPEMAFDHAEILADAFQFLKLK